MHQAIPVTNNQCFQKETDRNYAIHQATLAKIESSKKVPVKKDESLRISDPSSAQTSKSSREVLNDITTSSLHQQYVKKTELRKDNAAIKFIQSREDGADLDNYLLHALDHEYQVRKHFNFKKKSTTFAANNSFKTSPSGTVTACD
jgi:hypothetical protein